MPFSLSLNKAPKMVMKKKTSLFDDNSSSSGSDDGERTVVKKRPRTKQQTVTSVLADTSSSEDDLDVLFPSKPTIAKQKVALPPTQKGSELEYSSEDTAELTRRLRGDTNARAARRITTTPTTAPTSPPKNDDDTESLLSDAADGLLLHARNAGKDDGGDASSVDTAELTRLIRGTAKPPASSIPPAIALPTAAIALPTAAADEFVLPEQPDSSSSSGVSEDEEEANDDPPLRPQQQQQQHWKDPPHQKLETSNDQKLLSVPYRYYSQNAEPHPELQAHRQQQLQQSFLQSKPAAQQQQQHSFQTKPAPSLQQQHQQPVSLESRKPAAIAASKQATQAQQRLSDRELQQAAFGFDEADSVEVVNLCDDDDGDTAYQGLRSAHTNPPLLRQQQQQQQQQPLVREGMRFAIKSPSFLQQPQSLQQHQHEDIETYSDEDAQAFGFGRSARTSLERRSSREPVAHLGSVHKQQQQQQQQHAPANHSDEPWTNGQQQQYVDEVVECTGSDRQYAYGQEQPQQEPAYHPDYHEEWSEQPLGGEDFDFDYDTYNDPDPRSLPTGQQQSDRHPDTRPEQFEQQTKSNAQNALALYRQNQHNILSSNNPTPSVTNHHHRTQRASFANQQGGGGVPRQQHRQQETNDPSQPRAAAVSGQAGPRRIRDASTLPQRPERRACGHSVQLPIPDTWHADSMRARAAAAPRNDLVGGSGVGVGGYTLTNNIEDENAPTSRSSRDANAKPAKRRKGGYKRKGGGGRGRGRGGRGRDRGRSAGRGRSAPAAASSSSNWAGNTDDPNLRHVGGAEISF